MRHLDLSYNAFTRQECEAMSIELDKNHILYGLHFFGNDSAYVDTRGHIKYYDAQTMHSLKDSSKTALLVTATQDRRESVNTVLHSFSLNSASAFHSMSKKNNQQ